MRYLSLGQYIRDRKRVNLSAPSLTSKFFSTIPSTLYQVSDKQRLDHIAGEYYDGRGDLWWIIAAANNLEYPTSIVPGQIINVPLDYKTVLQAVGHLNSQQ